MSILSTVTQISIPLLLHLLHPKLVTAIPTTNSCSKLPFTVPLTNCTFPSGATSFGIPVEVGGPTPQRLCLSPSTLVNSTLLSVDSLCSLAGQSMARRECESIRGGLFDKNQSSTWRDVTLSQYNSTKQDPAWAYLNPPGITDVGYNTLRFDGGNGTTIYGFGIALNSHGYVSNMGMLGLGTDSLFLDRVIADKDVSSRSWSLDAGSQSFDHPRDGELAVGGYNQGRKDGAFVWQNVSDMSGTGPCPLRTSIKEMNIIMEDGSEQPLLSTAGTVEACIEPYENFFHLTPSMLSALKSLTNFSAPFTSALMAANPGNLSYAEPGLLYASNNTPKWSLSVTLASGYKTTLPQFELQRPLSGWDALGDRQLVPDVTSVAVYDAPTAGNEVLTLGKVFLSQSLLSVDYITNQFGLAPSKQPPGPASLISFDCADPSPLDNHNSSDSGSSKSQAIIGSAIGVPVGIAIVVLAFILWRKHGRKGGEEMGSPDSGAEKGVRGGSSAEWDSVELRVLDRKVPQLVGGGDERLDERDSSPARSYSRAAAV